MFGWFKSQVKMLTPLEAKRLLDADEIRLVDVREASEWRQGHVAGAIHMPLSTLASSLATMPDGKPVVFYCRSGVRSGKAITLSQSFNHGYDQHMAGGILAWQQAGLPIET